jgi:ABC-type phosphate transport system permease subunit
MRAICDSYTTTIIATDCSTVFFTFHSTKRYANESAIFATIISTVLHSFTATNLSTIISTFKATFKATYNKSQ